MLQLLGVDHHSEDWSKDGHQFAADICQEAVISVFQNLKSFVRQRLGSFRKWLDTIVRNAVLQCELQQTQTPCRLAAKDHRRFMFGPCADEKQGFQVFTKKERRSTFGGAGLELPEKHFSANQVQAVLRLITGEAKAREIADELGRSVASVYMLRHRVLQKLREYMEKYLLDFLD